LEENSESIQFAEPAILEEQQPSTSTTPAAVRKSYNFESIISLLVKTVHRNRSEELASAASSTDTDSKQSSGGTNSSSSSLFKLDFLVQSSDNASSASFRHTRIGNENDFIVNLLEQASTLNERCRLNIEKTVENINRQILAELAASNSISLMGQGGTDSGPISHLPASLLSNLPR
jgi:hypothetical protein